MRAVLSSFFQPITYKAYAHGLEKLDGLPLIPNSLKLHFCAFFVVTLLSALLAVIESHPITEPSAAFGREPSAALM